MTHNFDPETCLLEVMGKAMIGSNIIPGNYWEHISFRAELCGIAGSLVVINAVCQ